MHKHWLAMTVTMLVVSPLAPADPGKQQHEPPSDTHKKLAKRAGDYEVVIKFTSPDGKSMESKGTAKLTMILDGRFLQEENSGTMLGMPFSGRRLLGYNIDASRYEALWLYTGSPSMMTLTGEGKPDGKEIAFDASYTAAKGKKVNFAVEYRFDSEDRFTIDLTLRGDDGATGSTLQATYARKK